MLGEQIAKLNGKILGQRVLDQDPKMETTITINGTCIRSRYGATLEAYGDGDVRAYMPTFTKFLFGEAVP